MSQLKTMRELLSEQRESQAQRRDQTEQRHAEEMRWRGDTLRQMSDVQAALASLRDERQADHEQRAEEHARANSGGYLYFLENADVQVMRRLRSIKEIERAVKEVSRDVAETREQFLSVADGMDIDLRYPRRIWPHELHLRVNRAPRRHGQAPRGVKAHPVSERVCTRERVLQQRSNVTYIDCIRASDRMYVSSAGKRHGRTGARGANSG